MNKALDSINSLVQRYGEEVVTKMDKRIDQTADEILEYIKVNAPRSDSGNNHLADSFVKTKIGDTVYISSKTKGKLVHLIELGFKHTSGKFIKGRPFLIPSYAGQIVCLLSVGGNFMIVFMTVCMFLIMAGGY